MNKISAILAAATALAAAAPAAAQYANSQNQNGQYGNGQYGNGQNQAVGGVDFATRIERLRVRIQTGVQTGDIGREEAQPLRQQLRALTQLERQYAVGGLTRVERSELQTRLRALRQQVSAVDGGDDDAYERDDGYAPYGQSQSEAQSGRYDRAYDRDNDGFDDRDLDRDGRWDDDVRNGSTVGSDDDYQQPAPRSGLGGIVDRVLGTNGLRVGQRATGNLYALPSQYRSQYRDTAAAYYRTDGRQIYQIDARTQAVVRVYAMNR